jgi:hypothetical protein
LIILTIAARLVGTITGFWHIDHHDARSRSRAAPA